MSALIGLAGCATDEGPAGTVDYTITGGIGPDSGATLHIDPAGAMTRSIPNTAPQTAQLDPAALAELHAKIDAAQFPDLAAVYRCTGLCPDIASNVLHVTVELGTRSYSSAADTFFLAQPGKVPDGLVETIHALQQTFDQSEWR